MGRTVIVGGVDGDRGEHILVTATLGPDAGYASKNQRTVGHIVGGQLVPDPKGEPVSEMEKARIEAVFLILRGALLLLERALTVRTESVQ